MWLLEVPLATIFYPGPLGVGDFAHVHVPIFLRVSFDFGTGGGRVRDWGDGGDCDSVSKREQPLHLPRQARVQQHVLAV